MGRQCCFCSDIVSLLCVVHKPQRMFFNILKNQKVSKALSILMVSLNFMVEVKSFRFSIFCNYISGCRETTSMAILSAQFKSLHRMLNRCFFNIQGTAPLWEVPVHGVIWSHCALNLLGNLSLWLNFLLIYSDQQQFLTTQTALCPHISASNI